MKLTRLVLPLALLAALLNGCEEQQENELIVERSENALTAQSQTALEDNQAVDPEDDDITRRALYLSWVGIEGSETSGLTELTVKVKNNTNVNVKAKANIFCEGFFGRKGSRPFTPNAINLTPDEEGLFTLRAKKLPLQNLEGATSFHVSVDVKIMDPKSGNVDKVQAMPELYYRHSQDYETITVFTEQVLLEKYNGVIAEKVEQQTAWVQATGQRRIIGRLLDANDKATELTEEDLVTKVVDEEEIEHGVASGLWLEVLPDTDDATEDPNEDN